MVIEIYTAVVWAEYFHPVTETSIAKTIEFPFLILGDIISTSFISEYGVFWGHEYAIPALAVPKSPDHICI